MCDIKGSDSCGQISVMKSSWKSYETVGEMKSIGLSWDHWSFDLEVLPSKDSYDNEGETYSSP